MDADNDKALEHFVDSDKEIEESTFFKKIVGSVQKVIGNKSLTQDDLKPVLSLFKQRLMEKNVALDVADKITESVGQTLIETKTKSFTSVEATVKAAINDALVKILTPKRHIDLVAEVAKAKLEHKPYVVVFIGVNGVGKSTNLAKVAYMLKNSKFSVMLAACDNFRAGAVEQLKVHGKNLDLPVFDKGYKEEPPEIAYQAIKEVLY
jgi:signal recognition particle receptor subunit alpha